MPFILNHKKDHKTVERAKTPRHPYLIANYQPVDFRDGFPEVFDQGEYGSCGPNAMVGAVMYDDNQQGTPVSMLSRFFLYLNTRIIQGDVADDTGVSNEDLVQAASQNGLCFEADWPYDADHFAATPPPELYVAAQQNAVLIATPLSQDYDTVMTMLTMRVPIVAGISVYDSFMSDDVAASGIIPVPSVGVENLRGGHDIVICGANPDQNFAWLRNSWGVSWGINGYAKLPLREYLLNPQFADSLWAIRRVGSIVPAGVQLCSKCIGAKSTAN